MNNRFIIILFFIVLFAKMSCAMNCSQPLFAYPTGALTSRYGNEDASPFYQALLAQEQKKLGVSTPLKLKRMNRVTQAIQQEHNNPAFSKAGWKMIWLDEEEVSRSTPDMQKYILSHEVAHFKYRHGEQRFLEYYCAPLLGLGSVICAAASSISRIAGKPKKGLLYCSQLLAFSGFSKAVLDSTPWCHEKRRQWIKYQELQAHALALQHHDNPQSILDQLVAQQESS